MKAGTTALPWLRYLWAAPNTVLGAPLAIAALMTGGRCTVVDGVLEIEGGLGRWLLRRGLFLRGGASAMTLGHIVIGQSRAALNRTRAHERVHVRQCEHWGPFFVPAYLAASFWALLRSGHGYRDNIFERQARHHGAGLE